MIMRADHRYWSKEENVFGGSIVSWTRREAGVSFFGAGFLRYVVTIADDSRSLSVELFAILGVGLLSAVSSGSRGATRGRGTAVRDTRSLALYLRMIFHRCNFLFIIGICVG